MEEDIKNQYGQNEKIESVGVTLENSNEAEAIVNDEQPISIGTCFGATITAPQNILPIEEALQKEQEPQQVKPKKELRPPYRVVSVLMPKCMFDDFEVRCKTARLTRTDYLMNCYKIFINSERHDEI